MIILRSPCGLSLLLEVPVWDEIVDDGILRWVCSERILNPEEEEKKDERRKRRKNRKWRELVKLKVRKSRREKEKEEKEKN